MRTPHKCPVCCGTGLVDEGFYGTSVGSNQLSLGAETCHSCSGTGVVWDEGYAFFSAKILPDLLPSTHGEICSCPQEVKDGKPYVGDVLCPIHCPQVTCSG